jgi:hypothetical protein
LVLQVFQQPNDGDIHAVSLNGDIDTSETHKDWIIPTEDETYRVSSLHENTPELVVPLEQPFLLEDEEEFNDFISAECVITPPAMLLATNHDHGDDDDLFADFVSAT